MSGKSCAHDRDGQSIEYRALHRRKLRIEMTQSDSKDS
ncbi:hypothetical protein BSLA_01r4056 [Burkholderia stabilis]|nr:hypothetical protein BSLA_01r4056 [Burkholderia stabilis]